MSWGSRNARFWLPFAAFAGLLGLALAQKPPKPSTISKLPPPRRWTAPEPTQSPVANFVRISNPTGMEISGRPITVPRFFAVGEVPAFAAVAVNSVQLPTQCDVKTRWPDGSLQYAVMSFRIDIPAHGSADVYFVAQDSSNADTGLDAEAMLSDSYDLGAQMLLTSGDTTRVADAREMLRAGHFRYWLKGDICTQVIVEEVSPEPAFDIGFGDVKSFHPIFVLTFYPGFRGVRVEFIGENAWLTRRQDLRYSLALKVGQPLADEPVYQKPDFLHVASARWRQVLWSGAELPRLPIDHNLPYLIHSRALPNFDLSLTVSSRAIDQELAEFSKSDRGDLGGNGLFTKYMPTTGGRPELGIFTRWDVRYLYTFDPRLEAEMLANAGVSGHIPIHHRESLPGRQFSSKLEGMDALGKAASIDARPGFCSSNEAVSSPADRAVSVGPVTTDGWTPDMAHQPSYTFIAYLTNGDWYFLEELYFWASWDLASVYPGRAPWARGSSTNENKDSFGVIPVGSNSRSFAYGLRTIAHAALMAPDDSPEKVYFTDKLLNNIVGHEGRFNITDGYLAQDPSRLPVWDYGRSVLDYNADNPLYFWGIPVDVNVFSNSPTLDPAKVRSALLPWMHHMIYSSLGYVEEMGFPTQTLRRRSMTHMLGELTSPDYNPYLVEAYVLPAAPAQKQVFTAWAQVLDGFLPETRTASKFSGSTYADFSYSFIALAAASYLADVDQDGRKGSDAYAWLKANIPRQDVLNDNPKWALVPRVYPVSGSISTPESWSRKFKSLRKTPAQKR
jgi:hypothetical protein